MNLKNFFFEQLSNISSQELEEITLGNCTIKKTIDKRNRSLVITSEDKIYNMSFTDKRKNSVNKSPINKNNNEFLNKEPSFPYTNSNSLSRTSLNNLTAKTKLYNNLSKFDDNIIKDKQKDKENENYLELNIEESKDIKELISEENKNEINSNINIKIKLNKNISIEDDQHNKQKIYLKPINLSEYINSIFFF